jgi:hypothetical protein
MSSKPIPSGRTTRSASNTSTSSQAPSSAATAITRLSRADGKAEKKGGADKVKVVKTAPPRLLGFGVPSNGPSPMSASSLIRNKNPGGVKKAWAKTPAIAVSNTTDLDEFPPLVQTPPPMATPAPPKAPVNHKGSVNKTGKKTAMVSSSEFDLDAHSSVLALYFQSQQCCYK